MCSLGFCFQFKMHKKKKQRSRHAQDLYGNEHLYKTWTTKSDFSVEWNRKSIKSIIYDIEIECSLVVVRWYCGIWLNQISILDNRREKVERGKKNNQKPIHDSDSKIYIICSLWMCTTNIKSRKYYVLRFIPIPFTISYRTHNNVCFPEIESDEFWKSLDLDLRTEKKK